MFVDVRVEAADVSRKQPGLPRDMDEQQHDWSAPQEQN
jgi:hypothetical protein